MTPKTSVPARLFVLLARTAPVAVILRRGPSDWVQMIHWDTKNDVFTPGQWFHGRIYERTADLSPNGQLIVYSTYKPGNLKANPDYGDSWTAVSKAPYFTALALWPYAGAWEGGGYFADDDSLLLNHWLMENRASHPQHQPPSHLQILENDGGIYASGSVFEHRLRRDGWQLQNAPERIRVRPFVPQIEGTQREISVASDKPIIRYKKVRNTRLLCIGFVNHRLLMDHGLYRHSPYNVIPVYRYRMIEESLNKEVHLPGITWADFDQRNRLVLARNGKIFAARIDAGGLALTELADFNANTPEAIEAPAWAKKW
jgi:hypothetical protein